jgi:hypothetical protein
MFSCIHRNLNKSESIKETIRDWERYWVRRMWGRRYKKSG